MLGLKLSHVIKCGFRQVKFKVTDHQWYMLYSGVSYNVLSTYTASDQIMMLWLTHWGRVTHICVGKLTIIGSDNGLAPTRNQCWDIVNWNLRNKLQWNLKRNSYIFIQENAFENVVWRMAAILSRPQCVNSLKPGLVFYLWLRKVLANEIKPYIFSVYLTGRDIAQPKKQTWR